MAGKGSKPRPLSIPESQFNDNWDKIFGGKKREELLIQSATTDIDRSELSGDTWEDIFALKDKLDQSENIHDVWAFAKAHPNLHADGYRKEAFAYVAWWIDEYIKAKGE